MKKSLCVLAASLLISTGAFAQTAATDTPAATTPAAAEPATAAPAATTTTVVTAPASATVAELKDGTKIEITADGSVSIINADGSKTTAPDGSYTLRDGTSLGVKLGKKIVE